MLQLKKIKTVITLIMMVLSISSFSQKDEEISTSRLNSVGANLSPMAVTNDVPCSAISLTNGNCKSVFSPLVGYTTSTATNSTAGTGTVPNPTCWSSTPNETVWFSFVATTTAQKVSTDVQLSGGGVNNDNQLAVYSSSNGLCSGNFTLIGCQDDICNCTGPANNQQAELTVTGLTVGQTYWIAVDGDGNKDGTFVICTQAAPTNDACNSAQVMTSGVVYSSSNIGASPYTNVGSGAYPSTGTGDVNFTCGSTENMVFYKFTSPTTGNYYLEQSAQICGGSGSQVMVFKSTYTCATLPENPMTAASSTYELVCSSASTAYRYFTMALTAGQTYIIGVDGYAGDECSYQITIGPVLQLPVELVDFKGKQITEGNNISWSTMSETNNNYFVVEKSSDAINFETLGIEIGEGNSNKLVNYSLIDTHPYDLTYYRLKQVDYNDNSTYSNIISITRNTKDVKIIKIVNLLGQEVSMDNDCIKIIFYSDGTHEKIN